MEATGVWVVDNLTRVGSKAGRTGGLNEKPKRASTIRSYITSSLHSFTNSETSAFSIYGLWVQNDFGLLK